MNPEHIPVPLAGISSSNVHTGTFIRRQFVTREHRFFQGSRLYGIVSFKVIKSDTNDTEFLLKILFFVDILFLINDIFYFWDGFRRF